jgi:hypothetical protein
MNTVRLTSLFGGALQDSLMSVRPEYQKLLRETNSFLPLALPLPLPRSRPGAR